MANNKAPQENIANNPIIIVASFLFVIFIVEVSVLANLWAINEIADYIR